MNVLDIDKKGKNNKWKKLVLEKQTNLLSLANY